MTVTADISGLGADHHWDFDGDSSDQIGSVVATDTSITYASAAICLDATNCAEMNAVTDRISIASTADINNGVATIKSVGGWFMTTDFQLPFVRIYGEGTATTCFHLVMGIGNNLTAEVRDSSQLVQVYNTNRLALSRPYHLLMRYSDSDNNNQFDLLIDGVIQTLADPVDRQPDNAGLTTRNLPEFGSPAGTVGLDGVTLLMVAPAQQGVSRYNHWATWDGTELSDDDVRITLFERGALADDAVGDGSDSESVMQTAMDVFSTTTRPDFPVCIEISAVDGGGDFTLDVDDIQFSPLASVHIRYNGTADTLTLRNTNGSNCSIVSAPFGGSILLFTETAVTVTVLDGSTAAAISGARVRMTAASGGALPFEESVTIVRASSTATVTHTAHGMRTGDQVLITGVVELDYRGVQTITVTGTNTYTYTVSGSPATPATGTIEATFVMMDEDTNGSGIATEVYDYSADQPVNIAIRKGSASPYYKATTAVGTILISGISSNVFMVSDE